MHGNSSPMSASPVQAARVAIWRLYEEGYVDEDMATASLLAVDVGTRRRQHRPPERPGGAHGGRGHGDGREAAA